MGERCVCFSSENFVFCATGEGGWMLKESWGGEAGGEALIYDLY